MIRYAITDRARFPGSESERQAALVHAAAGWADEGLDAAGRLDFVQLREKYLTPAALAALGRRLLVALQARGADLAHRSKLLINSRADVAVAIAADGVHLTSAAGELTPCQVRSLYATAGLPVPIISLSCHSIAEVIAARGFQSEDGLCLAPDPATAPDLILFGPVFEKRLGDQLIADGTGLDLLRAACAAAAPVPVLALGGISEDNAAACLEAGAAGIAAIRMFLGELPANRRISRVTSAVPPIDLDPASP